MKKDTVSDSDRSQLSSEVTWTEDEQKLLQELLDKQRRFDVQQRVKASNAVRKWFPELTSDAATGMLLVDMLTVHQESLIKALGEVDVEPSARPIDWTEVQWVCLTDGSVGVMIRGVIYICYYGETRLVSQEDGLSYWIPSKTELGELLRQPLFEAWREKVRPTELGIRTLVKANSPVWRDGWDHIGPTDLIDVPKPPPFNTNTSEE